MRTDLQPMSPTRPLLALVVFLVVCFAAAGIGGATTAPQDKPLQNQAGIRPTGFSARFGQPSISVWRLPRGWSGDKKVSLPIHTLCSTMENVMLSIQAAQAQDHRILPRTRHIYRQLAFRHHPGPSLPLPLFRPPTHFRRNLLDLIPRYGHA